jgi:hypothetical protein
MKKIFKLLNNNKIQLLLVVFSFFLIIISVTRALYLAQIFSFDFHYSTSKLVSEGVNHYRYTLNGYRDYGPNDKLMYAQNGLYAQGLILLLIPFTWLDWDSAKFLWSIFNVVLGIVTPIILCIKFRLTKIQTFSVVVIFLTSTVFRINISYGQQSIFCFFFILLPFLNNSKIYAFFSGISYFKYNLGYVLFIYFLSLKKLNTLFLSLLPCVIGWLFYSYITDTNIIKNLIEPVLVLSYWEAKGALPVTFLSILTKINVNNYIIILISILLSFFVIYKIRYLKNDLYKLSLICLTSLAFASHQLHDYILLLPMLVFSIKNIDHIISKVNLAFIFYFFFFLRILSFFFGFQPWEFPYGYFGYLNNFLTILILFFNLKYARLYSNFLNKF